jgi:hypothetical protein
MFHYHIWCDLKDTSKDLEFAHNIDAYLGHLRAAGMIAAYTLSRRALGLGPPEFGEFHVTIDLDDLSQLDQVFGKVAARAGETENYHRAVYTSVTNMKFSLERDFPDSQRES